MSELAGTETQGQTEANLDQQSTGQASEPAEYKAPWADYLEPLPESVRPLVEPTFKKWDADVTQRFQQVHSEYEPLKPYQELMQQGFTPDIAQQAFGLVQALQEDPESVYRMLAESLGYNVEQGIAEPDVPALDDEDGYEDPRMREYMQMTEQMAEILVQEQQAKQAAEEDAKLDAKLNELREKYGDYDEEYVLAYMQVGHSPEEAVAKYQQAMKASFERIQGAQSASAPAVLGSGGGLPSQSINPAQLSSKDTKNLVAQYLAQANQQN